MAHSRLFVASVLSLLTVSAWAHPGHPTANPLHTHGWWEPGAALMLLPFAALALAVAFTSFRAESRRSHPPK